MLVIVDLVILVVYTAVEGANGNLSAIRLSNNENSMDVKGVSVIITILLAADVSYAITARLNFLLHRHLT